MCLSVKIEMHVSEINRKKWKNIESKLKKTEKKKFLNRLAQNELFYLGFSKKCLFIQKCLRLVNILQSL